ncbi:GTPase HflX [Gracilibacillus halotolerans]|uniref:GTPase HflX n=1 Tax=Gracilibacillus halotolerans TaxID=74386 RepID=UPI0031B62D30
MEKVLVLAVLNDKQKEAHFYYSLDELKSLVTTAGGEVIQEIVQKRTSPHRATYLGKGKLESIKEEHDLEEIDLIIANEELSGTQIRNLQDELGVRVIDRSQLILDIFAARAQTKEGQLQVELAQYNYMLPRLQGQGLELSRLGGGIGTRGPGETKLESDRRHILRRINDIEKRLKVIVNRRKQHRSYREKTNTFQIAIVGYTNAGKSTLFNHLTASDSLQEDKLFATLDPLTRQLRLPTGLEVIITDTVGFIQDLPTGLIAAFKSTLEEVQEADLIYHVVDLSAPNKEDHEETVYRQLKELNAENIPLITLYNKKDLISEDSFLPHSVPYLLVSALSESSIKEILDKTCIMVKEQWDKYHTFIPDERANNLSLLKKKSLVEEVYYEEDKKGYDVIGYVNPTHDIMKVIKEYQKNDKQYDNDQY